MCIIERKHGTIKIVRESRGPGRRSKVVETLARLEKPLNVCLGASCGYGHVYDRLRGIPEEVKVAHPGPLRLIFRSKRKHDRVEAKKLATLLLLDQVPEVYVPSVEIRSWRSLIGFHQKLWRSGQPVRVRLGHAVAGLW